MDAIANWGIGTAQSAISNMMQGAIGNFFATRQAYNNYQLNERAAQNADMRARQQYNDMYSISAQMRELKKAGLSPSLMYGNLPSVQGASGAQGGGASGMSAMFAPADAGMFAQIQEQTAAARKANVEADVLEGKNDRGQAEINNIITRTNNVYLQSENLVLQNQLTQMDVSLKGEYAEQQIQANLEQVRATTENLRATLKILQAQGKIETESANSIIAYYRQRVVEQQAEIALKCMQTELAKANIELTSAQVQKLFNDILVDNANIEISRRGVQIKADALQAQIEQWGAENGLRERGQNVEIAKTFLDTYCRLYENSFKILDYLIPF